MKIATITLKTAPTLYLEADCITPDSFAGKSKDEILALPVYEGRECYKLGDYFEIAGEIGETPENTKIVVNGYCSKVKYIGAKMSAGEVIVNSSADMYTGAWMRGGKLTIMGNVDSFSGLGMEGVEFTV